MTPQQIVDRMKAIRAMPNFDTPGQTQSPELMREYSQLLSQAQSGQGFALDPNTNTFTVAQPAVAKPAANQYVSDRGQVQQATLNQPSQPQQQAAQPTARMFDGPASMSGGTPDPNKEGTRIGLKGPDGQITWTDNVGQINDMVKQGFQPLRPDGTPMEVRELGGGFLLDYGGGQFLPIDTLLNGRMTPEQSEALKAAGYDIPQHVSVAPAGAPGAPGAGPSFEDSMSLFDMTDIPELEQINLAQNPQLSETFSDGFNQQFNDFNSGQADAIGGYFNQGDWPTAQAAQMDQSGIPQTTAQTPGSFDALEFLLSGQGFGDDVMSKLRANATDDIADQGRSQRGSARLMAEQSGLSGSPAAMALEAQANRNQGAATTKALNSIDIENAVRGLENQRMGAGMELNRQTSSADMTNQAALANAARLFAGMQQNVTNSQQANMTNAGFGQDRNMSRANAQAGYTANAAGNYNQAALQRANNADTGNVTNSINRNLNQAQLDRQRGMFNIGNQYGSRQAAQNNVTSMAIGSNAAPYNTQAAQIGSQFNPNLIPAQTVQNQGATFANAVSKT